MNKLFNMKFLNFNNKKVQMKQKSIFDFIVKDYKNNDVNLNIYKDNKLTLIVNVASN